jgi:hypothetical protein
MMRRTAELRSTGSRGRLSMSANGRIPSGLPVIRPVEMFRGFTG